MDLSQPYHAMLNQIEPPLSNEDIHEFASRYQIILLKGFLGDLLPKRFDSYFYDQMRWMRDHGIRFWRLERETGYGTQKLSQNNVNAIEKAIRGFHNIETDKRIIVVSHSKGGIDMLESLLCRTNQMETEVAGWIALQSPFWGTPVANWVTESRLFNPVAELLLGRLFNGDKKVAASMAVETRNEYMTRNSQAILELIERFDILSFASTSAAGDASIFRPLRFAIDQIARVPNDGLLPTQSEILKVNDIPCCPHIVTEHLDHIYAVLPLMPDGQARSAVLHKNRRIRIFTTLLKIWMNNRKQG